MNLNFGSRAGVFAALTACAAGSVSAQSPPVETGFYVGAFGGVASYPSRPKIILDRFTLESTKTREDDMSWGFTGGYRFSKYWALEAGYVDLGEATAHLVDSAGSDLRADLRFSARGKTFATALIIPTWKWETFIKVGMLFQDVDLRLDGTQAGAPFTLSSSAKGMEIYWEGGVSYHFDDRWSGRLGATYYPNVGRKNETGHVNLVSSFLGVSYQF